MNTLERTVSDALRAYGEGLDMTTQDVERLEQQLERTQDTRRHDRRGRIWQGAVAACAVTGAVLGGLALRNDLASPTVPAGPPAWTMQGLEGIWLLNDGSGYLWTFRDDGTLRATNQPYDPLAHTDSSGLPSASYRYTPDGFILHGEDDCDDVFAATLWADGRLQATVKGTTGTGCPPAGINPPASPAVWEMTRVSPVSLAGAQLPVPSATGGASSVNRLDDLVGTWLFRGSGTLLTVKPSGVYALNTFATLDRPDSGTVAVTGAGSLVFTPAGNRSCTVVFESVTSHDSTVDARVADGSCGRLTGATDTWIRLN